MNIFIGADHRGFELKEYIKKSLSEYTLFDVGADTYTSDDDYTTYASALAEQLEEQDFGILICGSGIGMAVAANKFSGIRASIGFTIDQVHAGRTDDDMNVLVIAADYTDHEYAIQLVETFLSTPFSGKERHIRRLQDIKRFEKMI